MRIRYSLSFFLWLIFAAAGAAERMVTEVIPVGYRDADDVAEILRPLVPPPGSVSSLYNQLIVQTTPANMRELKQLLASIDRAPANLLISVKHIADDEVRRDLAQVFGQVRSGDVSVSSGRSTARRPGLTVIGGDDQSSAGVNVVRSNTAQSTADVQTVRVLEGKEAFIATGTAVPLRQQSTIVQQGRVVVQSGVTYAQADSGFYARPRLSGDQVTLDIFSTDNRFRGSNIETREAATSVSGPLGRWMEIAGVSSTAGRSRNDIGRSVSRDRTSDHRIYLKVTRLPR